MTRRMPACLYPYFSRRDSVGAIQLQSTNRRTTNCTQTNDPGPIFRPTKMVVPEILSRMKQ